MDLKSKITWKRVSITLMIAFSFLVTDYFRLYQTLKNTFQYDLTFILLDSESLIPLKETSVSIKPIRKDKRGKDRHCSSLTNEGHWKLSGMSSCDFSVKFNKEGYEGSWLTISSNSSGVREILMHQKQ